MSKLAKALTAAAGNAGGESLYVEDVFSTYLYTGTGATQTITNGIDLDGEGGLVWIKERSDTGQHHLYDTERGATKRIHSNSTAAEATQSDALTAFNSDGFTLGGNSQVNDSGEDTCSWTFRKAEKFFDVVTYTGDGASSRYINHNLGANAGAIFIKRTDSASDWTVQHRYNNNYNLYLNSTSSQSDSGATNRFNDTYFTVIGSGLADSNKLTNISGATYVAYLFASDAGGFGDDGSENIIKCGSYTGTGSYSNPPVIDLGFEPQWVMIKNTSSGGDWLIGDIMRGATSQIIGSSGEAKILKANLSNAETSYSGGYIPISPTATGFTMSIDGNEGNGSGLNYIYIAIRRPMKTPESGTEVFAIDTYGSTGDGVQPGFRSTFPVDMALRVDTSVASNEISSRLTQGKWMYTNLTNAEASQSLVQFDYQNGWFAATGTASNYYSWMFKRATGFFDVVAYTGDGVAGRTVAHNLGVAPELMIFKNRSQSGDNWVVYSDVFSPTNYIKLNNTAYAVPDSANLRFNNTAPTDSVFTVGTSIETNWNGQNYISYHFATLAGVSKVGSYTGTGADLNVDCGFSAGARFVLIKRSDSGGTGDWYVYDSVRGIVAGNDPYLLLNSTAAEVTSTDYIDPLASGFTVTSTAPAALNASGGTYIFLAIA